MSHDDEDLGEEGGFGESSRYTAHIERGWHLLDQGDPQAARRSAEHAIRLAPDNPEAPMLLAAACLAQNDASGALAAYAKAIEIDPEYVEPHLWSLQVLLYDLEDGAAVLEQADEVRNLEEITIAELIEVDLLELEALLTLGRPQDARRLTRRSEALRDLQTLIHGLSERHTATSDSDSEQDDEQASEAPAKLVEFTAQLAAYAGLDADELDEDEASAQAERLHGQGLRFAKILLEVNDLNGASQFARMLISAQRSWSEAWHLLAESAFRGGEALLGVHASVRARQLDEVEEIPAWAPTAETVHGWVRAHLAANPIAGLADELAAPPGLIIVVQDGPPLELVLEGIDPKAPVHLASLNLDPSQPPRLTGIAVYRRPLCNAVRSSGQAQQELLRYLDTELHFFLHGDGHAHVHDHDHDHDHEEGKGKGKGERVPSKRKKARANQPAVDDQPAPAKGSKSKTRRTSAASTKVRSTPSKSAKKPAASKSSTGKGKAKPPKSPARPPKKVKR